MPTYIHDADGNLMAWAPDDRLDELNDQDIVAAANANGWTTVKYDYAADAAPPEASHWDAAAKQPLPPVLTDAMKTAKAAQEQATAQARTDAIARATLEK